MSTLYTVTLLACTRYVQHIINVKIDVTVKFAEFSDIKLNNNVQKCVLTYILIKCSSTFDLFSSSM